MTGLGRFRIVRYMTAADHDDTLRGMAGFDAPPIPIADIEREGRALVRTALGDRDQRLAALRRLAVLVVELRRYFYTDEASPDWRGRTWEYRQRAAEMFEAWGVPSDSAGNLQASLRYHVGNRLREVLADEELLEAGLRKAGPRERLQEARGIVQALSAAQGFDLDGARSLSLAKRLVEHALPEAETLSSDAIADADAVANAARLIIERASLD